MTSRHLKYFILVECEQFFGPNLQVRYQFENCEAKLFKLLQKGIVR